MFRRCTRHLALFTKPLRIMEEQPAKRLRTLDSEAAAPPPAAAEEELDTVQQLPDFNEGDVGISEYTTTTPGFFGVFKQRYTDFLVNEIDKQGVVVRLSSFDAPESQIAADAEQPEPDEEVRATLSNAIGDDLLHEVSAVVGNPTKVLTLPPDSDKDRRTLVHQCIKKLFPSLSSDTTNGCVRVFACKGASRKFDARSRMTSWPADMPQFLQFVLYKENRDSFEALGALSRMMHLKPGTFAVAGTKDKRGVTTQRVTAHRIKAERMIGLDLFSMRVGNFSYVPSALNLGDLSGNRFEVALRNIQGGDEHLVENAMQAVQANHFINYFGLQRFGTGTTVRTHQVGAAILRTDWEAAVRLLLTPDPKRTDQYAALKIFTEQGDAAAALAVLPQRGCAVEADVLKALRHERKNYVSAMQKVPRLLRSMYVHGFQSFVWNTVVSHRIRTYGLRPVPGDLVLRSGNIDSVVEDADMQDAQDGQSRVQVQVLTEADHQQYSINDVILPLPGFDIQMPTNDLAAVYDATVRSMGVTPSMYRHSHKEYALPGAYRRLIARPGDLQWRTMRYNDVNARLLETDLDRLNGVQPPQSEPDGKYLALILSFNLPTSAYATMLIREIMKTSTSVQAQAARNVERLD
eukprot:TRINITY_DN4441_c0_g1_i1.p1 TRINITY_DN4441_c0_g1~~TRINITY_DN4441_c0_g1_i1.p1  ORF type:complete len:633 (-),score=118.94 TRINITY_DN4441_c0_g1_i1:3-1901(-)